MTDDDLAALRRGEPAALDAFSGRYAEQVLAWAIALGGPSLDAEDVAQDVLEVALRRIGSFRGDAAPSTWLYGIARNVIRNRRRKQAFLRFIGLDEAPEPPSPDRSPDELLDALQQRRAVQHALERLGSAHREVLVLSELDGRSAPEVAEMLGIPVGTVYSRLHHARRQLAAALAREGLRSASTAGLVVVSDRRRT